MAEYNELTKKLLREGYTVENYPRHVRIAGGRLPGDNPLNNIYGGFEYMRWYADEIVYQTGCGKYIKGSSVINEMGCMGVTWSHENSNPVFRCPYDIPECPNNDSRLHGTSGGGLLIQNYCVCHPAVTPYEYENSIEKAEKERQDEKKRKYEEYLESHNGRVCRNHMYYDERTREWNQRYEPSVCATLCQNEKGYCPILGKTLSKKKGNVYYDIKTSGIYQTQKQGQISIIDGKPWTHIQKGVRYFDLPHSMDICEAFIKVQKEEITRKYEANHAPERMMDETWNFEIQNIRAEARPSRDLLQDLEDIKNGISISYDNELEKESAKRKKEQRAAARQKKIERLEKTLIKTGYENLEEYSLDKVHADKWLSRARIQELEDMRQQKIAAKERQPVQMNILDFIGG